MSFSKLEFLSIYPQGRCFLKHAIARNKSIMSGPAYSRPCVDLEFAEQLVRKLYNFERISEIKELDSFSDRNFYVRGHKRITGQEEVASNFYPNHLEHGEYVLKILNSDDSKHGDLVEAENAAMYFLRERGFPCPLLFPLAGGVDTKSLVRIPVSSNAKCAANKNTLQTAEYEWCIARLISFLPGQTARSLERKMSFENLFMVGKFIGNLSKAFQVRYHVYKHKTAVCGKRFSSRFER